MPTQRAVPSNLTAPEHANENGAMVRAEQHAQVHQTTGVVMTRVWRSAAVAVAVVSAAVMVGGSPAQANGVIPGGTLSCSGFSEIIKYSPSIWEANTSTLPFNWSGAGVVTNCTGNTGDKIVWTTFSASGTHPGPRTCTSAATVPYAGTGRVSWHTIDTQTHAHSYTSNTTLVSDTLSLTGLLTTIWNITTGPFAGNTIHVDAQITPFPASHCFTGTTNATGLFAEDLETPDHIPVTIP